MNKVFQTFLAIFVFVNLFHTVSFGINTLNNFVVTAQTPNSITFKVNYRWDTSERGPVYIGAYVPDTSSPYKKFFNVKPYKPGGIGHGSGVATVEVRYVGDFPGAPATLSTATVEVVMYEEGKVILSKKFPFVKNWVLQNVLNTGDQLANFKPIKQTDSSVIFTVDYRLTSHAGQGVLIGAAIPNLGHPDTRYFGVIPAGKLPQGIQRGSGTAQIEVRYRKEIAPPTYISNTIDVYMFAGKDNFLKQSFQFRKAWKK